MNKAFVVAASMVLALAAAGCADMSKWQATGGDGGTYMGGSAPVSVDPVGSATIGTGSVSVSGEDRTIVNAAGIGLDD